MATKAKVPTVAAATLAPDHEPPREAGGGYAAGASKPTTDPDAGEAMMILAAAAAVTRPSLEPPADLAARHTVAAWQSDKRVTGLWAINETRNAWAHIDGVGWRKLAAASDSGLVALNMLAAHARQTGARVDYNEDAGAQIDQLYVW